MAIKTYKPTTPSRRHMTVSAFEGIDKKAKPERSLTENLKKNAGRNSYGRITVRHRGGGNKKKYRIIDFKRNKEGTATVINLQYDPNRSANIALIQYEDGEKRYILAPVNLKAGHKIMTGPDADILPGNCLPIANIPVGEMIHCIELYPGKGAQLVRAAGEAAQLMAKENGMAQVRLPSGEVRYVREECKATIGSACPPARSATSARSARPPSARWATPTGPISRSVRPAVSVTWAGVPPSAALS